MSPKATGGTLLVVLGGACLAARLATLPDYPQNPDGVYFVRGVQSYSVSEQRPHWPGYPVYVWLGKLARLAVGDAERGLHVLSAVASALTLWPLAGLAARWRRVTGGTEDEAGDAALAAASAWALAPGSWLVGTELFSDPVALPLALASLVLCWDAAVSPVTAPRRLALAGAAAGLLLGTRLSYVALLLPLAWTARRLRVRAALLAFAAAVALWAAWQVSLDRASLFAATWHHLGLHVQGEGHSAVTDADRLARPVALARNLLVNGLGGFWPGTPWTRLPATAAILALLAGAGVRLVRARGPEAALPWLWAGPYGLWILVAHDVHRPRYVLPLLALGCALAGLGLPRSRWAARLAILGLALALGIVSVPLAVEHRDRPPVGYQLARHLARSYDPWATTLLVEMEDASAALGPLEWELPALPVVQASRTAFEPLAREREGDGHVVLATSPGAGAPEEWIPVARFCRSPLLDPRAHRELWLFRHAPGAAQPATAPDCR